MKLIVDEFVHGIPKAQPRGRATAFGGKARVYDPGTANGWKALIAAQLKDHRGKRITGPLEVRCTFNMPRPKADFGTGKNAGILKPSVPKFHTKKPDMDNLEKAVYDTLSHKSGIGVWHDDSQITESHNVKQYAVSSDRIGMRIQVYLLED